MYQETEKEKNRRQVWYLVLQNMYSPTALAVQYQQSVLHHLHYQ